MNMLGKNVIGRIYRPHKIINSQKRGFIIYAKLKSNYGGNKQIEFELNLNSNIEDYTEKVILDVRTKDNIKVVLPNSEFILRSDKEGILNKEGRKIEDIRSIIKPDNYNLIKRGIPSKIKNDKGILFLELYIDSENIDKKDKLDLKIYPTVIDNQEYIAIHAKCNTPVEVRNEGGVILK